MNPSIEDEWTEDEEKGEREEDEEAEEEEGGGSAVDCLRIRRQECFSQGNRWGSGGWSCWWIREITAAPTRVVDVR
jgi:hypothetical protein